MRVKVKSIKPAGKADVYNMEVELRGAERCGCAQLLRRDAVLLDEPPDCADDAEDEAGEGMEPAGGLRRMHGKKEGHVAAGRHPA